MAEALVWCVCNERRFYGACARGASVVRVPVAWSRAGCPNENPRWCQVGTKIQVGTEHWNPTKYDPPVELQYHAGTTRIPRVYSTNYHTMPCCTVVAVFRHACACSSFEPPRNRQNRRSASSFYTMQLSRARKESMLLKKLLTESQHAVPWEEEGGGGAARRLTRNTRPGSALHCTSSARAPSKF